MENAAPQRDLKDFVCRRCFLVLGQSDNKTLYLQNKPVPFSPYYIAFECPNCGGKVAWGKPKDKNILLSSNK